MNKCVRARYSVNSTPVCRTLSEEQQHEIYQAAVEMLERTGAVIHDKEALELFEKAGAWVEGERVRFPAGLTEWAVKSAPSRVTLYNREGERSMVLGGRNTYYGPGPTNTYHRDPETGERRRPVNSDNENAGKVCDALENIDFAMDLGTPTGVTDTLADVYAFKALITNCRKPIVHWGFDIEQYEYMIEMAAEVVGGMEELQKKPFFCLYSEPTSPLVHSREAIAKAIFAAKKRVPIVYTPCVMLGGTTPATMASTIALGVAESLVGIIASQLVHEGSPIIMGGVYAIMDMKTTVFSYGSPEFHLMQAGIAEVAHYMDIPVFGTAGCTDSHTLDGQAAGEATMSILMAAQSGANLVHDVGYTGSGSMGSLYQLVMCNEIIAMVKRFMRGIEVTDETLGLDAIDRVGPGGHHLADEHTMKYFKSETWFPSMINRMRYDEWKNRENASTMGDRVTAKMRDIIKNHEVPALPDDVLKKIDAIVEKAEANEAKKKKK